MIQFTKLGLFISIKYRFTGWYVFLDATDFNNYLNNRRKTCASFYFSLRSWHILTIIRFSLWVSIWKRFNLWTRCCCCNFFFVSSLRASVSDKNWEKSRNFWFLTVRFFSVRRVFINNRPFVLFIFNVGAERPLKIY